MARVSNAKSRVDLVLLKIERLNMHESPPTDPTPTPPTPDKAARRPVGDAILRDIERSMTKEPYDRVKCVHLFGDYFRVNWWSPTPTKPDQNKGFDWATRATHYVRKSQFLHATLNGGQLVVKDADRRSGSSAGV